MNVFGNTHSVLKGANKTYLHLYRTWVYGADKNKFLSGDGIVSKLERLESFYKTINIFKQSKILKVNISTSI